MMLKKGSSGDKVITLQKRLKELGFFHGVPRGSYGPLTETAVMAFQKHAGLPMDGIVGDRTWGALFGPANGTPEPAPNLPPPDDLPPWLLEAMRDLGRGVEEVPGSGHNPVILEAHRHTTLQAKDDETPWCSAIMCAWMERAGYPSTRSASAASWRSWGRELPDGAQRLGCVVVMSRVGGNHVALYLDEDDVGVYCLGGNQGDRVSVRRYPWEVITNFRWPA